MSYIKPIITIGFFLSLKGKMLGNNIHEIGILFLKSR